jgi:hypothetical protein
MEWMDQEIININEIIKKLKSNEIDFFNLSCDEIYALASNKEAMKLAVKQNWRNMVFASPEIKADKLFMNQFIEEHSDIIKYASDDIRNDKDIALKVLTKDGSSLQYFGKKIKEDEEMVRLAIETDPDALWHASLALRSQEALAKKAVEKGCLLIYLPEKFKKRKDFVETAVGHYGLNLEEASDWIKNDREVVLKAIESDSRAFAYASPRLREDRNLIEVALRKSLEKMEPPSLEYVSKEMKSDISLLMLFIEKDIFMFNQFIDRFLAKNKINVHVSNQCDFMNEHQKMSLNYWNNSLNSNPKLFLKLMKNEVLLQGYQTENLELKHIVHGLKHKLSQQDQDFFIKAVKNIDKKYMKFDEIQSKTREFPLNTFDLLFEYMETESLLTLKLDLKHLKIKEIIDLEINIRSM